MTPCLVTIILSGLRSRWVTLLAVIRVQRVEDLAGVLNGLVDTEGPLSGAPSMHSITR